ncbi:MAG: glucosyltransferase domain-containing protein [Firmicutes bacterium]|nr:glucosyltransferase domain-containing protein [Candidatus Colivicinus equi]
MSNIYHNLLQDKRRIKIIVISTIVWGLLAHGSVMFNLYSFFDNANLFNIGATFELGRWFLGFMNWLTIYFSGSLLYTTPLLNGALTILCIGISSYILSILYNIDKPLSLIILNGLMIVFPAVTSALGYMFTAPYYYIGILLGVIGIYVYFNNKKWYSWIISIILLSCGAGTYQANMHFFVGLILIMTIKETFEQKYTIKDFLINSLGNVSVCIGMLVSYFAINNVVIKILNISMSEYKNINNLGNVPVSEYINRVILTYKEFFFPTDNISRNMYVFSLMKFYKILIFILLAVMVIYCVYEFNKNKIKVLELIILFAFLPLANNFVFLMCDTEFVYSIMMYGQISIFIFAIFLINHLEINKQIVNKAIYVVCCVVLSVFCMLYTKFDNDCYLKADILQRQINSYITTIVTQIKSLDGYRDGMKIVYINEFPKHDSSIPQTEEIDSIYIHPYHMSTLLEDYNFRGIMERQIGFYPKKADKEFFEQMDEVKKMPAYPNEGSIKIIEDVIVIKFNN